MGQLPTFDDYRQTRSKHNLHRLDVAFINQLLRLL
jgi:hypothetical protein